MDINEPSLMDVAHDTINSTQGLAPFPDLAADGRAGPEFRPDSSLFELLPRTQTGRSQLSWTGQVRRDLRGTGEGVSIDLF